MLVVIAIIALFSAIIVPAVGNALDKSRQIKGGNNLRTWGQGWILYATENMGKLVTLDPVEPADIRQDRIAVMIIPDAYDINPRPRFVLRERFRHPNGPTGGWAYGTTRPLINERVTDISEIEQTSVRVVLADTNISGIGSFETDEVASPDYTRNKGKAWFCFTDGHIQLATEQQAMEKLRIAGER